jgi:hypothetical protein
MRFEYSFSFGQPRYRTAELPHMQYSFELSFEGLANKIRSANQYVPSLDVLISQELPFL